MKVFTVVPGRRMMIETRTRRTSSAAAANIRLVTRDGYHLPVNNPFILWISCRNCVGHGSDHQRRKQKRRIASAVKRVTPIVAVSNIPER